MSDPVQIAKRAREALTRAREASTAASEPRAVDVGVAIAQAIAALGAVERSKGSEIEKHATVALARTREAIDALDALGRHDLGPARAALDEADLAIRDLAMTPPVATPAIPSRPAPAEATSARGAAQVTSIAIGPTGTVKQPPAAGAFAPPPGPTGTMEQPPLAAAFAAPAGGTAPMGDPTRVAVSLDAASASHLWIGPEGGSVLARGGVFVAAEGGPDVGTPVRLALTLPGGSFDALGVVRWTRPRSPLAAAGYGVTLVELDGDGKRAVEAFAAARAPMLYGK